MNVLDYIRPELLILVLVMYALGFFLKKYPKFKDEWMIPFIILVISIVFAVLYIAIMIGEGFSDQTILSGIMQGILIAFASISSNELIKQYFVKRLVDKNNK